MPLHILKLCVGVETIADLESWIEENRLHFARMGRSWRQTHTTRMVPKRIDEIYWVIKGRIAARQRIEAIEPFTDGDGIGRCHLVLEPVVVPVRGRPCRPFQGWRYLNANDAPLDAGADEGQHELPEPMREELRALGLM